MFRHALASLLVVLMSFPFMLAGVLLVRFEVQRDRIVKEVCVQRNVPEPQRTCHGQCHLKKQLEVTEHPQDAPIPPDLRIRIEPAISNGAHVRIASPVSMPRWFGPFLAAARTDGHARCDEPVPWC